MNKLKALIEKRNAKVEEMTSMKNTVVEEVRAFTEEEDGKFKALGEEVRALDSTIEQIKETRAKLAVPGSASNGDGNGGTEETEVRAFAQYIRWGSAPGMEMRADVNLVNGGIDGQNGAIIPKTIADRIIKRIYDISPILGASTRYTVKGQLDLPYYDEETSAVNVAYAEEFGTLVASVGEFKKISLTGFLAGALAKVSRSLMNSSDVDLVSFVVNDISEKAARWLEKELLVGTDGKITGLRTCSQIVKAAATDAITLDELIDVQDTVPDQLQHNAMWIMNRTTRSLIRKLEDKNGRKYLQDDVTAPFGKVLLGKPVYTSDNMPKCAAGSRALYYGDMSGLAVKFAEDPTIEVVREKFIEQHAIGAFMWLEADAKIQVEQAIAALEMAAV